MSATLSKALNYFWSGHRDDSPQSPEDQEQGICPEEEDDSSVYIQWAVGDPLENLFSELDRVKELDEIRSDREYVEEALREL